MTSQLQNYYSPIYGCMQEESLPLVPPTLVLKVGMKFSQMRFITTPMVDRQTHKAHMIDLCGDCYRLNETIEWMDE